MAQTQINIDRSDIGQLVVQNPPADQKTTAETETNIETDGASQTQLDLSYKRTGDAPRILIISNDKSDTCPLPGYKNDAANLEEMWKNFGCKVTLHENLESDRMLSHITDFADAMLRGTERFCGVFILSHGYYDKEYGDIVFGTDGGEKGFIVVEEILEMFDNNQNEKLHDVPKLFVFQCCRGGKKPQAVTKKGASAAAGGDMASDRIPHVSDTIVMYATQPKNVAIVDSDGSWLIKAMLEVFPKHADNEHLADMLTIVNRIVSRQIVKEANDRHLVGVKCMSEIRSTLLQKLYLQDMQI